jgi:hypothetical protein
VLAAHFGADEQDFNAYVKFCDHLAPCVLERSVLAARSDYGPRNVCCGVLSTPSLNVLSEWSSWHVPSTANDLRTAHAVRTQGPQSERLSVYCQPRMSFLHNESIKGFGRARDGHLQQADPHVCGTSTRVLGSMVGMAQKPFEQQKRAEKGPCIDGRICSPSLLQPWENTVEFWKRARTGTLLPQASTATNDINKVKFEFVPYTGLWWDTAIHNAHQCDGIVKSFLLQSGVDDDISHFQFFTMLLRPYLEFKRRNDRVYGGPQASGIHKNAWQMPVLDVSKPFEFSSRPHLDGQCQPVGVNVNVCMSLVHYVLLQGLGVTKDWNSQAHDNTSFVSCVHMRNISQMSLEGNRDPGICAGCGSDGCGRIDRSGRVLHHTSASRTSARRSCTRRPSCTRLDVDRSNGCRTRCECWAAAGCVERTERVQLQRPPLHAYACEGADGNSWQSRPRHTRASNKVLRSACRKTLCRKSTLQTQTQAYQATMCYGAYIQTCDGLCSREPADANGVRVHGVHDPRVHGEIEQRRARAAACSQARRARHHRHHRKPHHTVPPSFS